MVAGVVTQLDAVLDRVAGLHGAEQVVGQVEVGVAGLAALDVQAQAFGFEGLVGGAGRLQGAGLVGHGNPL